MSGPLNEYGFENLKRSDCMAQEEQILVVERKVLDKAGSFHGLAFDVERYLEKIFVPGVLRFISRSQAEADPGLNSSSPT